MKFSFQAKSEAGPVRKNNQDSIYAKKIHTKIGNAFLGIVCDGMGGLSSGEVASRTVVNIFSDWFENEFKFILSGSELRETIKNQWDYLISLANDEMYYYGKEYNETMGTTLSALMLVAGNYYAVQIGDSRIYLCRDNTMFRVTTDHSYVMELAERGLMTYDEANLSKQKNILTRCIGSMEEFSADHYSGEVYEDDFFLISSDGFHGSRTDDEMRNVILSISNSAERNREESIEKAIENKIASGERDNVSAVCVKVEKSE